MSERVDVGAHEPARDPDRVLDAEAAAVVAEALGGGHDVFGRGRDAAPEDLGLDEAADRHVDGVAGLVVRERRRRRRTDVQRRRHDDARLAVLRGRLRDGRDRAPVPSPESLKPPLSLRLRWFGLIL